MFTWRKLGRVFTPQDVPGRPWMAEFAQAPATLVLDDVVRVYFSCRPPRDEHGQYVSYSAWVDLDRRDLTRVVAVAERPILELGRLGAFDEFGTYPVSVARDGDDVVAYYGGWTRCESVPFDVAIGCARSTDGGRTFAKLGDGPVLGPSPDEPFVISGPKIRRFGDAWHLFYIAGRRWKVVAGRPEPVYRIRMATSRDGLDWHRHDRDLIETRLEGDEAQASPDVIFAGGGYHMFFCYRRSEDYRGRANGYRIGYASSPDLVRWTRDDRRAGIDVSDDGWDSDMISYPHVFELDGATYLAYLGNEVGRHGFGLAVLDGSLGGGLTVRWRKLGQVLDPRDVTLPAGCHEFAQAPQVLVFPDFLRVYFSTRSADGPSGKSRSHVAYVDMDRSLRQVLRVAEREVIGLGGLGCFDEHGIFPFSVLRHGDEILAYTTGWSRRVSVSVDTAIGLVRSHDGGATFVRSGDGPVLAASLREPFLVGDGFVRAIDGRFHMWYIFGTGWRRPVAGAQPERTYKIGHAESPDGVTWLREDGRQIVSDRLGVDESQALPSEIEIEGRHHLYFCYRESVDFRTNPDRGYRIGHAVSDDLRTWARDDLDPLPAAAPGDWDAEMQCYPHVFELEGRVLMLYNGNQFGRFGFGAAVLEP